MRVSSRSLEFKFRSCVQGFLGPSEESVVALR